MQQWRATSPDKTLAIGAEIATLLPSTGVIALEGGLGAGKTHLAKGIISSLTQTSTDSITSPTFIYVQSYDQMHHFDLYRLTSHRDFIEKGFLDYLNDLCLVEWYDRIEPLHAAAARISIEGAGDETRTIELVVA